MDEQRDHQQGVTPSLTLPARRLNGSITIQPNGADPASKASPPKEQGLPEFVIIAAHAQTGRVFSPFVVRARDESAARKMCKRNYLVLRTVECYVEAEDKPKPRTLPYGPPISDRDFKDDYGNRPADTREPGSGSYLLLVLGWLMPWPFSTFIGWWREGYFDDGSPSSG